MEFNNIPNEAVTLKDGRTVFLSRSVTVACQVWLPGEKGWSIILTKRGPEVSEPGKWCFPCGYLDWNESTDEAARREVYEETGIALKPEWHLENWKTNCDPDSDALQNVTFHYLMQLPAIDRPDLTPINQGEVQEAQWISIDDVMKMSPDVFAFNHWDLISEVYTLILGYRNRDAFRKVYCR